MTTLALAVSVIAGLLVPGLAAVQSGEYMPQENWLPIERRDVGLNVIMRLCSHDFGKFKTWTPPTAEKL